MYIWGVKWTFILHLPISVIRISDIGKSFSDIGKSFSDIGKSSHFPISEIRNTDIGKSNFRCQKIILIYRYQKIIRYQPISESRISDIGKSFWFSDIGKSVDLPISEIRISDIGNSAWFSDIGNSTDLPKSVIQNDFPISVNQLIYRYRKFDFPISVW